MDAKGLWTTVQSPQYYSKNCSYCWLMMAKTILTLLLIFQETERLASDVCTGHVIVKRMKHAFSLSKTSYFSNSILRWCKNMYLLWRHFCCFFIGAQTPWTPLSSHSSLTGCNSWADWYNWEWNYTLSYSLPRLINALSMQNDSLDWYKIYGNVNEHKYWYLMASQNRS